MEREVLVRNDGSVWLKHRSIVSALKYTAARKLPSR